MENARRAQVLRQFDGNWDEKTVDGYLQWQPYCVAALWAGSGPRVPAVTELLDLARVREWNLPVPRMEPGDRLTFDPHFWFEGDRQGDQGPAEVVTMTFGWALELANRGVPPAAVLMSGGLWQRALTRGPRPDLGLLEALQERGIAVYSGGMPVTLTRLHAGNPPRRFAPAGEPYATKGEPVILTPFQQEALDPVKPAGRGEAQVRAIRQQVLEQLGQEMEGRPAFLTPEWHASLAAWRAKKAAARARAAEAGEGVAQTVARLVREERALALEF